MNADLEKLWNTIAVGCSLYLAELTDAELREQRLAARQIRDKCVREGRSEASLVAGLTRLLEDECRRRRRSRFVSILRTGTELYVHPECQKR